MGIPLMKSLLKTWEKKNVYSHYSSHAKCYDIRNTVHTKLQDCYTEIEIPNATEITRFLPLQ